MGKPRLYVKQTFFTELARYARLGSMVNPTQVVFVGNQCTTKADSERVIAYLYFAFNVGNLAGEFLSPVLRQQFGPNTALWAR